MFKIRLKSIWVKIENGTYVTLIDKFILYLNALGFTGVLMGVFAVITTLLSLFGGKVLFFDFKTITIVLWTLFIQKNWVAVKWAYKKAWNQIFPNGLKLPSGNIIK